MHVFVFSLADFPLVFQVYMPEEQQTFFLNYSNSMSFLFFLPEVPVDKSQMSQAVLVCTAHIHWDPEFRDVKLIQVSINLVCLC